MSEQKSSLGSFIEELKRRRVFRVAAVYLGSGYVILEASDMIFPRLGLPDWTVSFVMGLLALGLPVAIILAWAFEVTPDGLARAQKTKVKQNTDQKPLTSNYIIIALLALIAGILVYPRFTGDSSGTGKTSGLDPKSVAVLPFTTFSEGKDSEFFSDGITDVILTQLAKIKDLKVISRTSIMQYKNTEKPIREIAAELSVANVLEGSVQRAGDKVRIVSQLIKADSDEHIWAETFDRDYADIFELQSDVARAIASALKATLTPEEEKRLKAKPTDNTKAWDLYVRGKMLFESPKAGRDTAVVSLLTQAANADPQFLAPRTLLVQIHSNRYFNRLDPVQEHLDLAGKWLKELQALTDEGPELHLAQGYYYYYISLAFKKAKDEFDLALDYEPNNSELYAALGYINRRLGNWEEAYADLTQSVELNPNAFGTTGELTTTAFRMHKPDEGRRYFERLMSMDPDNDELKRTRIFIELYESGNLQQAKQKMVEYQASLSDYQIQRAEETLAFFRRDFKAALDYCRQDTADRRDDKLGYFIKLDIADSVQTYAQDKLEREEKRLDSMKPTVNLLGAVGYAQAALGQREAAMETIVKMQALMDNENDAFDKGSGLETIFHINMVLGDYGEALQVLEELLSMPSDVGGRALVISPDFDPLRDKPKFKELLRKYKPAGWPKRLAV